MVQEHKLRGEALTKASEQLRAKEWTLQCGPCDPSNTARASAGVGIVHKGHVKAVCTEPKASKFADAVKMGRAQKYEMDMGWKQNPRVYNIHGWAGGSRQALNQSARPHPPQTPPAQTPPPKQC